MVVDAGMPIIGGAGLGFGVGYCLKKIFKFIMFGIGLICLVIGYLEYQRWLSANWNVIENQTSTHS